jgi:hypothetical protein
VEDNQGVTPPGPGSRASHDASKLSSPKASIPNAGDVFTNTVEGNFSIFKRGMRGIYQWCSEKHLHRYLAEFDFRYCNRQALGVNDVDRADALLRGIIGKRLTYRTTAARA